MNGVFREVARIQLVENVVHRPRNDARMRIVFPRKLAPGAFLSLHRVRFSCTSLAVSEDGTGITAEDFLDDWYNDLFVDSDLA